MSEQREPVGVELNEPASQDWQDEVKDEKEILAVLDVDTPTHDDASTTEISAEIQQPAIQPLLARIDNLEQAITQLAADVKGLAERVEFVPRQVRQLGAKVDDITESVSQPRVRDLLGSFLLLHDLVEQMSRAAEPETVSVQNYQVLRDQITQVLRVNGISPIAEAQHFDPTIHKAVETVICETPDEDGEIVRLYRSGFRTERAVLRYAEVVVRRYKLANQEA